MSIEAMKQWLKSLQWAMHIYQGVSPPHLIESVLSLEKAIAEAEKQEPVATVHASWNDDEGFMLVKRIRERLSIGASLYTHPQTKREPLTDEQIEQIYRAVDGNEFPIDFCREIEAAHGIKGEA